MSHTSLFRHLGRLSDAGFLWLSHISALYGRPFLPNNFHKNTSFTAFLSLLKIIKVKTLYSGKITDDWNNKKFRNTGLNSGKMWLMVAFFSKGLNCGIPAGILQHKICQSGSALVTANSVSSSNPCPCDYVILYTAYISRTDIFMIWMRLGNLRWLNFAIFVMFSLL